MKMIDVILVRIYLTEADKRLEPLLSRLHDQEKVRGVTVFRGISGFGKSGAVHSSSLLDLSLDLPVVVEIFDTPDRINAILEHLETIIEPGHLVTWNARVNE
jgi:PII-like signaling protein